MSESLVANPAGTIDIVYAHNDPMAFGAYLAAKEKGREKEMVFIGIDGLPNEGAQYVKDGILSVSLEYPLCVGKAYEIGMKILSEDGFAPEKTYMMESRIIRP